MPRHRNVKMEVQNGNGHGSAGHLAGAPAEGHDTALETARLAYSYWEARGGADGSAEQDWARAEQELRERLR